MLPNTYFDPGKAQELYQWYFEEFQYASEIGFDGVMINEHHNNPLNMMPSSNWEDKPYHYRGVTPAATKMS